MNAACILFAHDKSNYSWFYLFVTFYVFSAKLVASYFSDLKLNV